MYSAVLYSSDVNETRVLRVGHWPGPSIGRVHPFYATLDMTTVKKRIKFLQELDIFRSKHVVLDN